jgi:hypothetical protein
VGTWGAGIFANDTAADVALSYRDLVGDGMPGSEATDRLIADHAVGPDLSGAQLDFWLGLAATQSRLGRLEERVKAKALDIIESGADLAHWERPSPAFRKQRRAALQRLRRGLLAPQQPPVHVKRRWRQTTGLEPCQHLLFRLKDGRRLLLRVLDVQQVGGSSYPVVMLVRWHDGEAVPSGEVLDRLGNLHVPFGGKPEFFVLSRKGPRDGVPARIQVLPGRWSQQPWTGASGWPCHWDELGQWAPPSPGHA